MKVGDILTVKDMVQLRCPSCGRRVACGTIDGMPGLAIQHIMPMCVLFRGTDAETFIRQCIAAVSN